MFSFDIMKIDQKLIRALLKAGFPLTSVAKALSELDIIVPIKGFKKIFPNSVWANGELYLPPTLESAFNALKSYKFLNLLKNPKHFEASVTGAKATGKTPLEALLKLYLKSRSK